MRRVNLSRLSQLNNAPMNKYLNKKTVIDGITFDSRKEARFYMIYKQMEKDGEISDLKMQVPFELIPPIYKDEVKHLMPYP